MKKSRVVMLSLGSNIENRKMYINEAILSIKDAFQCDVKQSRLYETAPWGFEAESSFLNCCISFDSFFEPKEILKTTQSIEKKLGRVKNSKNKNYQSRVIDIDILYVGSLIVSDKNLQLPHPLTHQRSFVLTPLVELFPDFVDPVRKDTILQLFEQCNDENKVILYED